MRVGNEQSNQKMGRSSNRITVDTGRGVHAYSRGARNNGARACALVGPGEELASESEGEGLGRSAETITCIAIVRAVVRKKGWTEEVRRKGHGHNKKHS